VRPPRIPPNLFAIPFGLAGLGDAWHAAAAPLGVPLGVANGVFIAAAAAWLVTLAGYLAQGWQQIQADFADPVLGTFMSLAVITPTLLAGALATSAPAAARVLVLILVALTVLLGGWITGQWIAGKIPGRANHPGYFLPTVAGPLVGAAAAATVGLHGLAEATFGAGVISWLVLGSIMLNRLFFRPPLPAPLVPTLAIEAAPAAVAGIAYFAIDGGRVDFVARALGSYAILMAVAQLRLVPVYARLSFSLGFWSFTFSYAAIATDALLWLHATRPPGATAYGVIVVALITLFVGGIAVRSVVALRRGQFLPARPPARGPSLRPAEQAAAARLACG
jgi:tellurite resistance protein